MPGTVKDFTELDVYKNAMSLAMEIFEMTKGFPKEEKYSLVDQTRRSSRSICTNLAEAWKKRRYKAAFIAKLSDAEGEATETLSWIDISARCKYLESSIQDQLTERYRIVLAQLATMSSKADQWVPFQ